MGIFDRFRHHKDEAGGTATALKDRAAGVKDSAGEMMSKYGDQAGQGLDKAGQMINDRTGGKYENQINTGVNKAKDMLGDKTGQASGTMDEATAETPRPETGSQDGEGDTRPPA
jgi:hypothetical protein